MGRIEIVSIVSDDERVVSRYRTSCCAGTYLKIRFTRFAAQLRMNRTFHTISCATSSRRDYPVCEEEKERRTIYGKTTQQTAGSKRTHPRCSNGMFSRYQYTLKLLILNCQHHLQNYATIFLPLQLFKNFHIQNLKGNVVWYIGVGIGTRIACNEK